MLKRTLAIAALVIACCGSYLIAGATTAAAAVQDDASYDLQIMTRLCAESPCNEDEAEPIGDVTVQVTSEDGAIDYGTCTTSVDGKPDGCSVMVDPGTTVSVEPVADTIPDGYALLEYPVIYDVPAEKTQVGDVWLYFTPQVDTVPDDQDTDEEVGAAADGSEATPTGGEGIEGEAQAQLPSTGAGPLQGMNQTGTMATLAMAGLVIAGGAFALRRRGSTNA